MIWFIILLYFRQGLCPGLTHGQKYGISYVDSVDMVEEESKHQKDIAVKSHSAVVVSNQAADTAALSRTSDHAGNVCASSEGG